MKKVLILFIVASSIVACKNDDKKPGNFKEVKEITDGQNTTTAPADTANYTTIQWLDSTFLDLGKRKQGKEIEVSFRFKNTGTKNLVIENVHAECGCTVPEKPEKPFAPGEEGLIKAKYNGSGHGETRKRVYVSGNIKPNGADTLTFRADMTDN
jgi:hypothetical protein